MRYDLSTVQSCQSAINDLLEVLPEALVFEVLQQNLWVK